MSKVVLVPIEIAAAKSDGDVLVSRDGLVAWLFESIDASDSEDGKKVLRLVARALKGLEAR